MKVLLVDDQAQPAALHKQLFGERALVCQDVDELEASLDRGEQYSAAYIDFDLSGGRAESARTGLSTLLLLKQRRPDCRRIVYTSFGEGGRELFAAAAHLWFGVSAVIDKSLPVEQIARAAERRKENPTPDAWQHKLEMAHLIDALFADPAWVDIWRVYYQQAGNRHRIVAALRGEGKPWTGAAVDKFANGAWEAAQGFQEGFLGPALTYPYPEPDQNSPRKVIITSFALRNASFFQAPDLPEAVKARMPWKYAAIAPSNVAPKRPKGLRGLVNKRGR